MLRQGFLSDESVLNRCLDQQTVPFNKLQLAAISANRKIVRPQKASYMFQNLPLSAKQKESLIEDFVLRSQKTKPLVIPAQNYSNVSTQNVAPLVTQTANTPNPALVAMQSQMQQIISQLQTQGQTQSQAVSQLQTQLTAAQTQATNSAQQLALAQGTMQAQNIQTQQMQQQFNVSQQFMQSQNQKKMDFYTAFTQLSREDQIMEIRDLYRELRNTVPELDSNDTNYMYQHFGFTNINVKDNSSKVKNGEVFNKLLDYIFSENLDSQVNINLDLQGASAS
jgi:hypothetical protein